MASIISELFIKFGGSSAALERATERVKLNVKQTAKEIRKETGQARDATELLGRTFGVQLPRQVQKFLASVGPVRAALANAFAASIMVGFGVAIGAAAIKLGQFIHEFRTGAAAAREFEAEVSKAIRATSQLTEQGVRGQLANVRAQQAAVQQQIDAIAGRNAGGGGVLRRLSGAAVADQVTMNRLIEQVRSLSTEENKLVGILGKFNQESEEANRRKLADAIKDAAKAAKEASKNFRELTEHAAAFSAIALHRFGVADRPSLLRGGQVDLRTLREFLQPQNVALPTALRDFGAEARKIWEETRTLGETAQMKMIELNAVFASGKLDLDTYNRAVQQIKETLKGTSDLIRSSFGEAMRSIGEALDRNMEQWRGWGNLLISVLDQVGAALIRNLTGTTGSGGLFSTLISAIIGGFGGGLKKFSMQGGIPLSHFRTGGIPLSGRQHGGPVFGGRAFMVGEGGPEIFVPHTGGQIVPNGKVGGGNIIFQPGAIDARGGAPGIEHRIVEAVRLAMRATRNAAVADVREISVRSL